MLKNYFKTNAVSIIISILLSIGLLLGIYHFMDARIVEKFILINYYITICCAVLAILLAFWGVSYYEWMYKKLLLDFGDIDATILIGKYKILKPTENEFCVSYITNKTHSLSNIFNIFLVLFILNLCANILFANYLFQMRSIYSISLNGIFLVLLFVLQYIFEAKNYFYIKCSALFNNIELINIPFENKIIQYKLSIRCLIFTSIAALIASNVLAYTNFSDIYKILIESIFLITAGLCAQKYLLLDKQK